MTQYLMNHPNQLIPLTFCEKFKQAKSSISEDVQIIKNTSKRKARYSYYDCWCEWWCNLQTNDE